MKTSKSRSKSTSKGPPSWIVRFLQFGKPASTIGGLFMKSSHLIATRFSFNCQLILTPRDVSIILHNAIIGCINGVPRMRGLRFDFPVALSASLRTAIIFSCYIIVQDSNCSEGGNNAASTQAFTCQTLDVRPTNCRSDEGRT